MAGKGAQGESQLEQQELAAEAASAAADLLVLQAFYAIVTNPASTIAQVQAGFATMLAGINDPQRLADCQSAQGQYTAFVGQINTLISQANAAAGN